MGRAVARWVILCLGLLILVCGNAKAQTSVSLETQDLSAWETLWEAWFPEQNLKEFLMSVMDGETQDPGGMLEKIFQDRIGLWLQQAAGAAVQLILFVVLEIFASQLLQGTNLLQGISGSRWIILAVSVLCLSGQLLAILKTTLETLEHLSRFLNAAIPVLMPLLLASGWSATSGLLQPATLSLSVWMDQWLRPVMEKGVSMIMMLCMVNAFHAHGVLKGVVNMGKRLIQWFMGLCFTGFIAVVGMQASAMLSYDSLALRSARYTVDSTLPGAGSFFADMLDTAVVSAQMIRNSLGLASLIVLAVLCLEPVIRIVLCIFTLDAAGALGGVLGNSPLAELYKELAALTRLLLYGLLSSVLLVFVVVSLACMASAGL